MEASEFGLLFKQVRALDCLLDVLCLYILYIHIIYIYIYIYIYMFCFGRMMEHLQMEERSRGTQSWTVGHESKKKIQLNMSC